MIAFLPLRFLDSSYTRADGQIISGATGNVIYMSADLCGSNSPLCLIVHIGIDYMVLDDNFNKQA